MDLLSFFIILPPSMFITALIVSIPLTLIQKWDEKSLNKKQNKSKRT